MCFLSQGLGGKATVMNEQVYTLGRVENVCFSIPGIIQDFIIFNKKEEGFTNKNFH